MRHEVLFTTAGRRRGALYSALTYMLGTTLANVIGIDKILDAALFRSKVKSLKRISTPTYRFLTGIQDLPYPAIVGSLHTGFLDRCFGLVRRQKFDKPLGLFYAVGRVDNRRRENLHELHARRK